MQLLLFMLVFENAIMLRILSKYVIKIGTLRVDLVEVLAMFS